MVTMQILGAAATDYSGFSVSNAGDVNGDGISDIIIGAYNSDAKGRSIAGTSYVIFGSKTAAPPPEVLSSRATSSPTSSPTAAKLSTLSVAPTHPVVDE